MKSRIIFLLIIALISFNKTIIAQIPTTNLIAYYPFNGNAGDSSGNGYNGIINGATLTTDRFGNANSAYSFNGTSDYILVNHNAPFNIDTSFSVSAWFMTTDPNLFYKSAHIVSINQCNFNRTFNLWVSDQTFIGDYIYFDLFDYYDGYSRNYIPSNYWNDNWHNIICTYGYFDGYIRMYLDGQLMLTNNIGQINIEQNTIPLTIGAYIQTSGVGYRDFFQGLLDDIRIYNMSLSQSQVTAIFNENNSVGIKSFTTNNDVKIYPNPSNNILHIDNINKSDVILYNVLGDVVLTSKCISNNTIDLSTLKEGCYYVKVISDNNILTKKINIIR